MAEQITLTLPEALSSRVRQLAEQQSQPVESIVLSHLERLLPAMPALPPPVQAEIDALQHLSDDALQTIAREQMPEVLQSEAHTLMTRNTQGTLTGDEQSRLNDLVERADRLMLRKAEAALLLQKRGYEFTSQDFKSKDE